MQRLSIARSLQLTLLGLTIVLTALAGIGVAALYSSRQDYEDRLAESLTLQAAAARLLAAGVIEEATLRVGSPREDRRAARDAFEVALERAREQAQSDARSGDLVEAAAEAQATVRGQRSRPSQALDSRRTLAALAERQDDRIDTAREEARDDARVALIAIIAGGGLALLAALVFVASLLTNLRRPLDELVAASQRLAGGDLRTRVDEGGPEELRVLAGSFNAMASDLERARERLESERRRLAVTIQALGDGLLIVNPAGRITALNPRAQELAPGAGVGTASSDGGLRLPSVEAARAGEVITETGERTLAITAAPLDGGFVVWTLRDVTERAQLERLKSEFVATASHELRSPLTSIKGFVELLAATDGLDERQKEFVRIVGLSTDRLVELVNDLLDVARIEAGRVEIHRRPTDLGEVVREVGALLRPRIEAKQQVLELSTPDLLPRALVDPDRIRQVLTNLVTNAHLYTPDGGRVAIDVRQDAGGVQVVVTDSGRGMSPDELDHVFERFYRGGEQGADGGTGLGLSIVKSLVDLHQGSIVVASELGQGTEFTITLPRAPEADAGVRTREILSGRRVLVLDDEPHVAALIAAELEAFGVEAVALHDGDAALARLRAEPFDAITVDILMQGMSGFTVLHALRTDETLGGIPAVVVSAFSGREALSGEWVVSKPIDAGELADALGAAVLSGRVRVLVLARAELRPQIEALLSELGIEAHWAASAHDAGGLCARHYFEVALVDAGLPGAPAAVAALDLRGRRLRRSVVVFSDDGSTAGFARLDAKPIPLADAGATVLGLLRDGRTD